MLGNLKSCCSLLLVYFLIELSQSAVFASTEKYNSGWQLNIDNNVFQRYMKDRDYTAGIAYTASGSRAQSGWLNIDAIRAWIFND